MSLPAPVAEGIDSTEAAVRELEQLAVERYRIELYHRVKALPANGWDARRIKTAALVLIGPVTTHSGGAGSMTAASPEPAAAAFNKHVGVGSS